MEKGLKIGIGVGVAIGVIILATRHTVRTKGYSRYKIIADTFNVPYKPMVDGLDRKYADLQEQAENEATKDGIAFNAVGLDPSKPCGMGGTKCTSGKCIKGKCVQSTSVSWQ